MKEKNSKNEAQKPDGGKKKTGVLPSQKASSKNGQAGEISHAESSGKNSAVNDISQSATAGEKTVPLSGEDSNEKTSKLNGATGADAKTVNMNAKKGGGADAGEKTAKLNGVSAAKEGWLQASEKQPQDRTEELLNAVASSARTSKTVIGLVLPQVADEKLKAALTEETAVYDGFLDKVKQAAKKTKAEINEPNPIGKFISDSGVRLKLFFNSDTTDIAELLITEKTSEVIELGREVKQLSPVSSESRLIAADLLKFHETQINSMKYYL